MSEMPQRASQLSPLKQALLALEEMQSNLDAMQRAKTEPIAIVGLGCRFPGGANDPETLWRLLRDGVDAIVEIPADRWNVDTYYDSDPDAPGKMYMRYGGFLNEVDKFDAQFFGISPRETASLDPQQRLLLEVSWEALENAGVAPNRLAGSQTGVFVGVMENDYAKLHVRTGDSANIGAYYVTGNQYNFTAGRISYILGLHGPSMAVDTACSSSLVAIHLACQSLRSGESNLALAGGVNLILSPELSISMCKFRALSADGRCKTFDAAADGFGQAEGCGMVVLKRLSDAVADGDNILAMIRGSAINHDGPSGGLTVPNGLAQQALIHKALANAGVRPSQVGYVEAHGTGTILGDPIEVRALGAVLGEGRSEDQRLVIGSVKTNLGHLQSAAGVAGLAKVVLSLQHEEIPPHLHLKKINPHIALEEIPVTIPTVRIPWPAGRERRIAGISSFGLSGTNVHMLVEEAPPTQPRQAEVERPIHLLALSAKGEEALKELAGRLERYLTMQPSTALADVCFTANTGRSHFDHRLAVVAESSAQMGKNLAAFAARHEPAGVLSGQVRDTEQPQVAFLFTGQGAQYVGMGRRLYATQPTFRDALDRCDELLRPHLEQPLLSILYARPSSLSLLDETAYTQPALFALEYALAELWRSWGVEPSVLMGHSVGEYVAACVAGVFSLKDGLKLIAERGRLMQALPKNGTMAVVFAEEAGVKAAVAPHAELVSVAAVNGPMSMVISGERNAMQTVLNDLRAEGVRTQPLNVSHAFHSPLMEPILDTFEKAARQLRFNTPRIPLISNLTGQMLGDDEIPDAVYWRRHIRGAVQFSAAMETLDEQGFGLFLEVGPNPILLGMGRRCIPDRGQAGVWLPSLRESRDDWEQMLESLGSLYVHGLEVNWEGFDRDYACGRRRVALPTYPFQRQQYWLEEAEGGVQSRMSLPGRDGSTATHPLLGQRVPSPLKEIQFETHLRSDFPPFLSDHRVYGRVIVPGTVYLEMALGAANEVLGWDEYRLQDITFREALVLPIDSAEAQAVQLILTPDGTERASFQVVSRIKDNDWKLHATGDVRLGQAGSLSTLNDFSLTAALSRCQEVVDAGTYYAALRQAGLEYGPHFQGISRLWRRDGEVLGQVRLPDAWAAELDNYQLHPALLDAALHLSLAAIPGTWEPEAEAAVFLPIGVRQIGAYRRLPSELWVHVLVRPHDAENQDTFAADVHLLDNAGQFVAGVESLYLKRAPREALQRVSQPTLDDWLYEVAWEAQDLSADLETDGPKQGGGNWLIFTDRAGVGTALSQRLQAQGESSFLAVPSQAFAAAEGGPWQVNPSEPVDFQRLVHHALDTAETIRGVVYLWGLDSQPGTEREQEQICGGALHLVQALATADGVKSPRLWLVTRGTQPAGPDPTPLSMAQAPLWGLGGAIATEHSEFHCVRVDLDPWPEKDETEILFREIWFGGKEAQVAFRTGNRYVARLVRYRPTSDDAESRLVVPKNRPFQLAITSPGLLDTLRLQPTTRGQPGPGEVEIRVQATGLNFKDILKALGRSPTGDNVLGDECSGIVSAVGEGVQGLRVGDEVVALAVGSFRSLVITRAELVAPKPDSLCFADVVTMPIVYLTAFHTLHHLAKISAGKRVLIHAAAGGVGMMAVQLAQKAGAEIFATAGSPRKRALLRSLGVHHVMNSRTLDFADEVMTLTNGQGVDVVLNSLAGDFIPKSLSVLAPAGCFLEIGKTDIWDESQVAELRPDAKYFAFDLRDSIDEQPDLIQEMLHQLMKDLRVGALQPLPRRVFPIQEAAGAFRYMAQAKHIGKIVLSQEDEVLDFSNDIIRGDATYLISGGLGGLGLEVSDWLAAKGARHLVLIGRRGATGTAPERVHRLEAKGVQVMVAQADVSDLDEVAAVLGEIREMMPPLRGVIHAAAVLDDGVLLSQTWSRFAHVFAPKVDGAWNLHTLTRDIPLDFFVLFSSVSSLLALPGQGNYVAANAFLDALAHCRRAQGLSALSINWGAWGKVGLASAMDDQNQRRLTNLGLSAFAPEQGIHALEQLLQHSPTQVGVLSIDWQKYCRFFPAAYERPFLTHLIQEAESPIGADMGGDLTLQSILTAEPSERDELIETSLREMVGKVLRLPATSVGVEQPLINLGLDSLMALELFNRIEQTFGKSIRLAATLQAPTVRQLAGILCEEEW